MAKRVVDKNAPDPTKSELLAIKTAFDRQLKSNRVSEYPFSIKVGMLTPKFAQWCLDNQHTNRRIKPGHTDNIRRDILADAFADNGDTLRFDEYGRMIDGQHRCDAVVKSSKAVRVIFVYGLSKQARITIDRNKVRTVADSIDLDGRYGTWGSKIGAVAKVVLCYMHDRRPKDVDAISMTEIFNLLQQYPSLIECTKTTVHVKGVKCLVTPAVLGALKFLVSEFDREYDGDRLTDFIETTKSGSGSKNDSAFALVEYLQRAKGRGVALDRNMVFYNTVHAWNLYAQGEAPPPKWRDVGYAEIYNVPVDRFSDE